MSVLQGPWRDWSPVETASSVTIGVLDGVHRGHQALIAALDATFTRTVLTFDPHPIEVLQPGTHARLITTIDERVARLGSYGVSRVAVLDLAEVKDLAPEAFVSEILIEKLRTSQLVIGADFRFGKDRAGDVDLLRRMGAAAGFDVEVVDLVGDDEGVVSSSRIRYLIETGRLPEVLEAMGARYRTTGTVIDGDSRGRKIGFPTANIAPPVRKVIPAIGVYAALCDVEGTSHQAAVNVGVRPTFGEGELLIEAHLLDFDDDLYGKTLTVEYVTYVRPELKFDSVDDLIARMHIDVEETRRILSGVNMS